MSGMNITASDLLSIIKTCGESKVESLVIGEISLKFYNNEHHNQNGNIALSQDATSLIDEADGDVNLSQPTHDQRADREDFLAQLSIDDPVAYEELMLKELNEGN